jgi:hypothetical protein
VAVYEGARPRPFILPRRPRVADAPALPRRTTRLVGRTRAGRRSSRTGLILTGIVVAFLLAFFSLAQNVSVSAMGYDLSRLGIEEDRLHAMSLDIHSDLNRLGTEPAIRKLGLDAGLGQLGEPIVLPAR